jgi:hypothetical protein
MLNKLILRTFLSITLAISFIGISNATLISQDILDEGNIIGNITIDIDNAIEWDINDYYVESFVSFNIFNIEMLDYTDSNLDNPLFEAHFNDSDLNAGLLTLDFDLNDVFGAFAWNGLITDSSYWVDPIMNENTLDVFDSANTIAFFSDQITFGDATVDVPEPSVLILFLTGLVAFSARRKVSK